MFKIIVKLLKKGLKMAKKLPPGRFYLLAGAFGFSIVLVAVAAVLHSYAKLVQALS